MMWGVTVGGKANSLQERRNGEAAGRQDAACRQLEMLAAKVPSAACYQFQTAGKAVCTRLRASPCPQRAALVLRQSEPV